VVSTNVYIQKNLRQFSCGKYGSSNEHQNVYELKVDFGEMFDNEKSFEEQMELEGLKASFAV
jgi:hypothetical protein